MILLLDFGNSRCKAAIADEKIVQQSNCVYTQTEKIDFIESLIQKYPSIQQIVICSVLGQEFNKRLVEFFKGKAINDYYFLNPAIDSFGIQLAYENPDQLGADRLAAMLAAKQKYTGNICVIDCGTAITIDVLSQGINHKGGVILPGVTSQLKALSTNTEISFSNIDEHFNVLAKTTEDGMHTGCLSAVAGGIEYVIKAMQEKCGSFDQIIITGGGSTQMKSLLSLDVNYESMLVLDGLFEVNKEL